MELMEAILNRQACRSYEARQIDDAALEVILQAGNAAPVGRGQYDKMHLTVVQKSAILALVDCCTAEFFGDLSMHPLYGAPTLIVVSADSSAPRDMSFCNAGCIVENMHLAATALGLGSVYLAGCTMAAEQNEEMRTALQLPEGYLPVSALAVGYAAGEKKERFLTTERIATDYIK